MSDGGGGLEAPAPALAPALPDAAAGDGDEDAGTVDAPGSAADIDGNKEAKWFELVPVILANVRARGSERPAGSSQRVNWLCA